MRLRCTHVSPGGYRCPRFDTELLDGTALCIWHIARELNPPGEVCKFSGHVCMSNGAPRPIFRDEMCEYHWWEVQGEPELIRDAIRYFEGLLDGSILWVGRDAVRESHGVRVGSGPLDWMLP